MLGGKGVIGQAISKRFIELGHQVFAVGREDFNLQDDEQIRKYFERSGSDFDILIHSGGHNVPKSFKDLTDLEIQTSIDVNLIGFLKVVRYCLPYWSVSKFGRIVVISSLYGFLGRRGRLPYVLSKHALNGAVKTLAIELAPHDVLVNSVSPGYVETSLTYRNNSPEELRRFIEGIPLNRLGRPSEVAKVVEFLCSDLCTYITGQDLIVDGGYSIGGFQ